MNAKKLTALILALLMVCAVFFACGGDGDSTETTSEDGEVSAEESLYEAQVPEGISFDDATFTVMSIDPDLYPSMLTAFDYETDQDEVVSAAIYKRNRIIESKYGVKFVTEYMDIGETYPALIQNVDAGDDVYQLMMLICREAFPAAIDQYALLSSQLPYTDTTQPWYNSSVNDTFSLAGMQIIAYTTECLNGYLQNECFFFNADIIEDKGLDDPYQLVEEGTWTKENFYRLCSEAIEDVNGDGSYSVVDGDIFGVISENDHFYPSMWVGAGIKTIGKDSDDLPVYLADGNEKLINVLAELTDKVLEDGMYCSSDVYFTDVANTGDNRRDAATQYFTHGGGLFRAGCVGYVQLMRNMDANFGILPLAKYDESQTEYYSRTIDGWLHVAPSTVQDTTMVGVIIEALGAESSNYVIPAFFDVALDNKYVREEGRDATEKSLEIIFNNALNDLGDTIWLNYVRGQLCMVIDNGVNTFSSKLSAYKNKVEQKCINGTIEDLEELRTNLGI